MGSQKIWSLRVWMHTRHIIIIKWIGREQVTLCTLPRGKNHPAIEDHKFFHTNAPKSIMKFFTPSSKLSSISESIRNKLILFSQCKRMDHFITKAKEKQSRCIEADLICMSLYGIYEALSVFSLIWQSFIYLNNFVRNIVYSIQRINWIGTNTFFTNLYLN